MKLFFSAICLALALVAASPARAQTIIRDTEIEDDLKEWFKPIVTAAGMDPDQVKIIIVQDDQVNAFVAGGANIFLYTGLLQKTDSPAEVLGVMGHELGHIVGGHLIRGREAMEQASYESIIGMVLGGAAAVASGNGGALGAGSAAGNSMAQRGYLKNSRTFESSADQAALRFFDKAQLSPAGLESFMKKLEDQELLPTADQSEYVQSHPLTRDRIQMIDTRVESSPYLSKPYPAAWTAQHKMMKAKLAGFITPQQVAWTYDDLDTSREALAARAIAAYRTNDVKKALALSDQLIAKEPDNPYFLELKGQMLVDFGRLKEGIPFYERAVGAKPDAALIRIALAHAQVETAGNDKAKLAAAVKNLTLAQKDEPRSSYLQRLLATAYGRMGDEPRAKLHLAEEALLQRKNSYARDQAKAAMAALPKGSPDWVRASDIVAFSGNKAKDAGDL